MAGTRHFSRIKELLSHRDLSEVEWNEIRELFESNCAFCGCPDTGNSRTGIVPGHVIPAAEHGEHCLGNIVPACQVCNDHRGKKEWRRYLQSEFTDDAIERIRKIEQYLARYPYAVPDDR